VGVGVLTANEMMGEARPGRAPLGAADGAGLAGRPVAGRPRVVAPGRLERAYQARIGRLEGDLEASALVERGTQRRCERVEGRLEQSERHLEQSLQTERRLCATLGRLEGENALLRERIVRLGPGRRRSWLASLLGRAAASR
jgi:hypothetical protein